MRSALNALRPEWQRTTRLGSSRSFAKLVARSFGKGKATTKSGIAQSMAAGSWLITRSKAGSGPTSRLRMLVSRKHCEEARGAFVEKVGNWEAELVRRKGIKTEEGREEKALALLKSLQIAAA